MNDEARSPLLTTWAEYSSAVEQTLGLATHAIDIFDHDLTALKLERPPLVATLTAFLRRSPQTTLRIAVRNADPLRCHHPRVLDLLRAFAHKFHVRETPPHLASLNDSMLIVDGSSALIRFHEDHARSKTITGDEESCRPYCRRFDEIWAEGGTPVSATVTGL